MKHYIVNGKPQSGKDTFVDELIRLMDKGRLWGEKISSVDRVKMAAKLLGWDGAKDAKGRKFLSDLKDLSTFTYDGPLKYIRQKLEYYPESSFFIFIREPKEIQKLIDAYPTGTFETILITGGLSTDSQSNHADKNVENFAYDHRIYNTGTLEMFMETTKKFYDMVIKKNAPLNNP